MELANRVFEFVQANPFVDTRDVIDAVATNEIEHHPVSLVFSLIKKELESKKMEEISADLIHERFVEEAQKIVDQKKFEQKELLKVMVACILIDNPIASEEEVRCKLNTHEVQGNYFDEVYPSVYKETKELLLDHLSKAVLDHVTKSAYNQCSQAKNVKP